MGKYTTRQKSMDDMDITVQGTEESESIKEKMKEIEGRLKETEDKLEKTEDRLKKTEDRLKEIEDTILGMIPRIREIQGEIGEIKADVLLHENRLTDSDEVKKARFPQMNMKKEIDLYEYLRREIEDFCDSYFFQKEKGIRTDDGDEAYYWTRSWFYGVVYDYVKTKGHANPNLKEILDKWTEKQGHNDQCGVRVKDSFVPEGDEKLKELIDKARKNYFTILSDSRYEVVSPEKNTSIEKTSEIEGKYEIEGINIKDISGRVVKFCIYPGILETEGNSSTTGSKKRWSVPPKVWV